MKNQFGLVVGGLGLACLLLVVFLVVGRREANRVHEKDSADIQTLSNSLGITRANLEESKSLVETLRGDMDNQKQTFTKNFGDLTNKYTELNSNLIQTQEALKASQDQVAKHEARIAELENQNQILDKQAADLSTSITNLTVQIESTQKKLAATEGDKAFLEKELKRLMVEKAELERQFNDLTVLRAQVTRLKEELSIARRMEMIRQGLFARTEMKGAQALMQHSQPTPPPAPKPNYDLNVEVSSDGQIKQIIPATNQAPVAPVTK